MKSSLSHVESETLATRDHGKGFSRRGVRDGHNGCAFRLIMRQSHMSLTTLYSDSDLGNGTLIGHIQGPAAASRNYRSYLIRRGKLPTCKS